MTETELRQLAAGLVPLRINLSTEDTTRWLDVVEVVDSELVSDEGFVVVVRAVVNWPERRLLDSFTVPKLAMLIEPGLESTAAGVGLVVRVRCHDLDLRWVPDFVDRRVVDAVNERLREAGVELRWDLSETLSLEFSQPDAQTNIEAVSLDVSDAELAVDGHRVVVTGPMDVRVIQQAPRTLTTTALPKLPRSPIA